MRSRFPAIPPRPWLAALCVGVALLGTSAVQAAECPKDKILAEHADIGWKDDVGIRRKTLEIADLTGWRQIGDLRLRMRRLTIPPGGVIPTHEHNDRPSLVYFVTGEVIEHSSKCAVPIVHRAGESDMEWGDYRHWWENKTASDVVLIGVDIVSPDFLDDPSTDEPQ
jgi:quercetin dioxygenase-like cupin family protein